MTRIERAFGILLLLGRGGTVTAPSLAGRFEVSVRTIYRDIEMLSATGIPVYAERGTSGGYRLHEGFFLPPVGFSRAEAVVALLGLALIGSLKVPLFEAELQTAERKLVAAMPSRLRTLLAETRRLIGFEQAAADVFHPEPEDDRVDTPEARKTQAKAVETYLGAVLDGTRVSFGYRSPYQERDGAKPVQAEAHGLLWDRDRWYLLGNRHGDGGRRIWRADRVRDIAATTFRAKPDPDFDVRVHLGRRWLAQAMGSWSRSSPVRILMPKERAERLRRDWYFGYGQFSTAGRDQMEMLYGENEPARVFELVRWLGPGAQLLEPADWRPHLARELEIMALAHGGLEPDELTQKKP